MTPLAHHRQRSVFRRSMRQVGSHWPHLLALFFVSVLAVPLTLLLPIPLKIAVDNVINKQPLPGWLDAILPAATTTSHLLTIAAILQVLIVLMRETQVLVTNIYQSWVGENLTLRFRGKLLAHTQRVAFAFHDTRGTADSIYRIQYDAKAIENVAVYTLIPVAVATLTFCAMVVRDYRH